MRILLGGLLGRLRAGHIVRHTAGYSDGHQSNTLRLGSSVLDAWPLTRAVQDTIQVPHSHDRPISQVSSRPVLESITRRRDAFKETRATPRPGAVPVEENMPVTSAVAAQLLLQMHNKKMSVEGQRDGVQ